MAKKNPKWSRDELILALALYKKYDGNPPGISSSEIIELSKLLNAMGKSVEGRNDDFRNPSGVYMKVMNFRRFDSAYTSKGKVGLQKGGKGDEEVWNIFAIDDDRLLKTSEVLKGLFESGEATHAIIEEEEVAEAEEGRILTRVHRMRERSRVLVEKKKARALTEAGRLVCAVCGFDFEDMYGERGKGFIEVHHTKPIASLKPGSKTALADLVLLCSNCHRMVHAKTPWLSIEQLRTILQQH